MHGGVPKNRPGAYPMVHPRTQTRAVAVAILALAFVAGVANALVDGVRFTSEAANWAFMAAVLASPAVLIVLARTGPRDPWRTRGTVAGACLLAFSAPVVPMCVIAAIHTSEAPGTLGTIPLPVDHESIVARTHSVGGGRGDAVTIYHHRRIAPGLVRQTRVHQEAGARSVALGSLDRCTIHASFNTGVRTLRLDVPACRLDVPRGTTLQAHH